MTNFRSAVSLTCCCTTYSAFSWLSCWHWWEHILYYVYIHIQWYFAKGRVTFKLIVVVVVGWKQLMLERYTAVWRLDVFGVHVESLHCISQRNYGCRDISECRLYCFLPTERSEFLRTSDMYGLIVGMRVWVYFYVCAVTYVFMLLVWLVVFRLFPTVNCCLFGEIHYNRHNAG